MSEQNRTACLSHVMYIEMNSRECSAFEESWKAAYDQGLRQEAKELGEAHDPKLHEALLDIYYDRYLGQEGYTGRDSRIEMARDALYEKAKKNLGDTGKLVCVFDVVVDSDYWDEHGHVVLVRERLGERDYFYLATVAAPATPLRRVFNVQKYIMSVRGHLSAQHRTPPSPVYAHPCDGCRFVGWTWTGRGHTDVYLCGDSADNAFRSVVGRFGDGAEDLSSTIASIALRDSGPDAPQFYRDAAEVVRGRL